MKQPAQGLQILWTLGYWSEMLPWDRSLLALVYGLQHLDRSNSHVANVRKEPHCHCERWEEPLRPGFFIQKTKSQNLLFFTCSFINQAWVLSSATLGQSNNEEG